MIVFMLGKASEHEVYVPPELYCLRYQKETMFPLNLHMLSMQNISILGFIFCLERDSETVLKIESDLL